MVETIYDPNRTIVINLSSKNQVKLNLTNAELLELTNKLRQYLDKIGYCSIVKEPKLDLDEFMTVIAEQLLDEISIRNIGNLKEVYMMGYHQAIKDNSIPNK